MKSKADDKLREQTLPGVFSRLAVLCRGDWAIRVYKSVFFIALFSLLYTQIEAKIQEGLSVYLQGQSGDIQFIYLLLAIILMPVNWFLETNKWLGLIRKIEEIHFFAGLRAVLVGVCVSLFTPNRIGEYGGRALMVSSEKRGLAVWATLIGSSAQWLILMGGGLISFIFFAQKGFLAWREESLMGLYFGITLMGLGILYGYVKLQDIFIYILRFRFIEQRLSPQLKGAFIPYERSYLIKTLIWALLRYMVYSIQFILLLYCFNVPISIVEACIAVGLIYSIQTGIPLPPSTGLVARGNLALWIFGLLLEDSVHWNPLAVLAATFVLWVVNVILPALMGALFLGKRKF